MDKLRKQIDQFEREQHWVGSLAIVALFRAVASAIEDQNNRLRELEDRNIQARRKAIYAKLCDAPKARATVDARPAQPKRSKVDLSSFIEK